MTILELWFDKSGEISLGRSAFVHPLLGQAQYTVRGKTSGALANHHTFQWTPGVRALMLLLLHSRMAGCTGIAMYLEGEAGSPAASLDYAIAKQPNWILDMFGVDSHGRALVKRLIKRTNPERKRPGPVILALNVNMLRPDQIKVYLNGAEVHAVVKLAEMAADIEQPCGYSRSINKLACAL